jgi:hypothetical protein
MFVPSYSFTIIEYDPHRPWVVVAKQRGTVELENDTDFAPWALTTWPEPRYKVELDPGQLGRCPA